METNNKISLWTEEEIISKNKLIAAFDGYVLEEGGIYRNRNEADYLDLDETEFLYHAARDLLMGIIDKIEALDVVDYTKSYSEHGNVYDFEIFLKEDTDISTFKSSSENKIEAMYDCVVQFIEWYNKNK